MKFRTLLLLGFTALTATLSGCIIETTSSGGSSANCAENQYFNVRWGVEQSLGVNFTCVATPASHVVLSTNAGTLLDVGANCQDGRTCSDGTPCNWAGSTFDGLAVGTRVVSASLISDIDGSLLSSSDAPQIAIQRCTSVELGFLFPI